MRRNDETIAPTYVASKGRPDAQTFQTLAGVGLGHYTVVEPQDADTYSDDHHLLLLGENDRGLAFARQACLDHARARAEEEGTPWYWMLDDDVSGFFTTNAEEKRNERADADDVLRAAEDWTREHGDNVGIVALEYQQFAWNATPGRATMNSYTDCVTLIHSDVLAEYRFELPLKVDRDFTLQVLAGGMDTARLRWLSFAVPTNGTNDGGLHDVYDSLTEEGMRREEWASRRLAELWPGIVEYKTKPNGRPDAKIHWRRMRSGR